MRATSSGGSSPRSAATHELKASSGRDLTPRFRAVLDHYRLRSSRITPGRAHENGVGEQAHRRLKSLVALALLVRGHAAFDDLAAYEAFVQEVVAYWRNRAAATRLAQERPALRALPSAAIPSYTSYYPVVRSASSRPPCPSYHFVRVIWLLKPSQPPDVEHGPIEFRGPLMVRPLTEASRSNTQVPGRPLSVSDTYTELLEPLTVPAPIVLAAGKVEAHVPVIWSGLPPTLDCDNVS